MHGQQQGQLQRKRFQGRGPPAEAARPSGVNRYTASGIGISGPLAEQRAQRDGKRARPQAASKPARTTALASPQLYRESLACTHAIARSVTTRCPGPT